MTERNDSTPMSALAADSPSWEVLLRVPSMAASESLENVKAVVEASGLSVTDIVKMTVFVQDLNDFGTVNEVYGKFFDEHKVANYPARSCVEVARLPKDVGIEIEAIALRK